MPYCTALQYIILHYTVTCMSVTVDVVRTGNRLTGHFDTARDYILQFTITHTLTSTVMSLLPLFRSGFQQRTLPFLWIPELSPASATSLTATAHND
jgi:hypothetical protein